MRFPSPLILSRLSGVAVVTACGGGGTTIVQPPPPPTADFILTLVPHPDDAATGAALGWQSGVPAMAGTIMPADSSAPPAHFTAGGAGLAVFRDLPAGDYLIEAARWLDAGERSRLGNGDDAVGFAGRWRTRVSTQGGGATLEAPASRRHGLVISEWAFNPYWYKEGGFLELYNNADTTIYLDGLVIGEGWSASLDAPVLPCVASAPYRNDPQGIWSRLFQRFPGIGREYPLPPGSTVVVATDAIDHRPFAEQSIDLTGADFEFAGPADVDNPAVPNMIDAGLIAYPSGHGLLFSGVVHVPFISRAIDLDALERVTIAGPTVSTQWVRFPAGAIIDALAMGTQFPPPMGYADCPPLLHENFDRKESRVRGPDEWVEYEYSVSRRRVPGPGPGLLQWTRSGDADFVRTRRTPGPPTGP